MLRDFNFNLSKFPFASGDDDEQNDHGNLTFYEDIDAESFKSKTIRYYRGTYANGTVNIIIGAIMILMVFTVVCCVLYFSHRNLKKRSSSNRRRWMDSDANMEIYSVEQFFDATPVPEPNSDEMPSLLPIRQGPPPPYESVVTYEFPIDTETNKINVKSNSLKSLARNTDQFECETSICKKCPRQCNRRTGSLENINSIRQVRSSMENYKNFSECVSMSEHELYEPTTSFQTIQDVESGREIEVDDRLELENSLAQNNVNDDEDQQRDDSDSVSVDNTGLPSYDSALRRQNQIDL